MRDGVPEDVQEEVWGWGVVYDNSEELKQFDDEGFFHQFQEINQDKVRMFVMQKISQPEKRFDLFIQPGMQIFHLYRNFIFNSGTPEEMRVRIYVFGFKDRANGHSTYHYILPNGNLLISARGDAQEIPIEVFTQQ